MFSSLVRSSGVVRVGAVAVVAALAIGATAANAEKVKIIYPTPPTTFGVPHYVAMDKGWYAKDGLEIEEIGPVNGDGNAFRALIAGEGDVCVVGPPTVMMGILKGAKVRAIGSWQPRVDYQFITNKRNSTKFDKGLEGLAFGSGGATGMLNHMITMMMKKHGLDPSTVKHIAIGGHSDRLAAVIAGKVNMTLVNTLTAKRAVDQVNIVAPVATELGGMGYVYIVATEATLQDPAKHAALVKLLKHSTLGARYTMADPVFAAQALHKRAPETPFEIIRETILDLNATEVWGTDGGIPDEITAFTAGVYHQFGEVTRALTPDEVLDRSVVKAAIAQIGSFKPKS